MLHRTVGGLGSCPAVSELSELLAGRKRGFLAVAALALAGCGGDTSAPEAEVQAVEVEGLVCPSPNADQCPSQIVNQDLRQPHQILPQGDLLETSLTVRKINTDCVPFWDTGSSQWQWCQMDLRQYGSPSAGDPDNLTYTFPGPRMEPNPFPACPPPE